MRSFTGANHSAGTIGRARNLTGTNALPTFIGAPATSVAVRGNFIYYTNYNENKLGRLNSDGSNDVSNFILGASSPYGVAVNRNFIYWGELRGRHDRARQHQRRSEQRQPELHHRGQLPDRGGGRPRARLLGESQHQHHRARRPRRHDPPPCLHHGRRLPSRAAVDRHRARLGQRLLRLDRARQHQRRSEQRQRQLHHRCQLPRWGGGRRRRHLLVDSTRAGPSGAPASAAIRTASTRASSPGANGPEGVAVDAKGPVLYGLARRRSSAPDAPTSSGEPRATTWSRRWAEMMLRPVAAAIPASSAALVAMTG